MPRHPRRRQTSHHHLWPGCHHPKGEKSEETEPEYPHYQTIQIPARIITHYRSVRLFIDIFWVNGNLFFHRISEWVKFCTAAAITNQKRRTLHMETQVVVNMYKVRGFTITSRVKGGHEFACIMDDLIPTPSNIADVDDHVTQVEQSVQTIKERTRCLLQGLSFKRILRVMMRASFENSNKTLNISPARNGVSSTLSPPKRLCWGNPAPTTTI